MQITPYFEYFWLINRFSKEDIQKLKSKLNICQFQEEKHTFFKMQNQFWKNYLKCFSLRQNILIRHIKEENLPFFYQELAKLDMVNLGYDSLGDITACPGTDTCNLGIASSTGIAQELERVIKKFRNRELIYTY